MRRDVVWRGWNEDSLEHLRLTISDNGVVADGTIVGVSEGRPFRLRYLLRCDGRWRVRDARIASLGTGRPLLTLRADGTGSWDNGAGAPLPALAGCLDLDLSATPFTNTLPIRRLALEPGESAELAMVFIDADDWTVTPTRQRYRRLAADEIGERYRFETLDGDFVADLPVDADGLVVDYPGLFRRTWPV